MKVFRFFAMAAALTAVLLAAPADGQAAEPTVKLETSMGDIVVQLNSRKAPLSTANFLQYVKSGFYDGTIFHRVIKGFMIQGGGLTQDMKEKSGHAPIKNEASNGLRNQRYTIAMARTSDPDSATSQFFINTVNNRFLDADKAQDGVGYAVFGEVIKGTDVVRKIEAVPTTAHGNYQDVPATPVVIKSATVLSE
ncbi:MAG: peptidylprolyl isomerase [Desulfovibrio sp.]|nr:peptidylprolyl isomerase [Desulfovibrio sp.]